jgi:hypothetical protein
MFEGRIAKRDKHIYISMALPYVSTPAYLLGLTLNRRKLLSKMAIQEILNHKGRWNGNIHVKST